MDKSSLGPNAKYLAKAREAKRQEEEDRRRKLTQSSSNPQYERLTHEEKQRLAKQMVEDGKQREDHIAQRAMQKKEQLDEKEQELASRNPKFLKYVALLVDAVLTTVALMPDCVCFAESFRRRRTWTATARWATASEETRTTFSGTQIPPTFFPSSSSGVGDDAFILLLVFNPSTPWRIETEANESGTERSIQLWNRGYSSGRNEACCSAHGVHQQRAQRL